MDDESMKFIGGRLCLDFVNTVDAWADAPHRGQSKNYGDTALREKLVDFAALVRWGRQAGVLSENDVGHLRSNSTKEQQEAEKTVARALGFRRALYRLFKSVLEYWEPEPSDLIILQRELAIARMHEILVYQEGSFHWTWDATLPAVDRMLWPVSLSAAELLTSIDLTKLRQCQGDECGWLFLDTSRNGSRHWCDMNDCGNLAKVRRFRMRAKTALAPVSRDE